VKIKIVVYALVLSVLITASDLLFHGNGGFPVLLGTFLTVFVVSILMFNAVAKRQRNDKVN
jgi:hypothetical protein